MKESEERSSNIDEQKARIRQRYKGIDPEELEVIPALPPEDIFKTEKKLRVAVYARVSTDDPRQTSSYELQKNHYQDVVNKNPNWMLVEIYADEGISGTSLQHRDAFKKMIKDCEAGKIDLIKQKVYPDLQETLLTVSDMYESFLHSVHPSVYFLKQSI